MDLIYSGEADLALELCESAEVLGNNTGPDWIARLQAVKARALHSKGRFESSLNLATDALLTFDRQVFSRDKDTWYELRINEATNLMQLNRADEAVERLLAIRSELLLVPDCASMAWCSLHLSSAELLRGDQKLARRFALEAIVSARRSSSKLIEGLALDNLGRIDRALCRWSSSEESTSEALEIFETRGYTFYSLIAQRCLGIINWKRGRLAIALDYANTSIERAMRQGSDLHVWYATLLKGMIMLHKGNFSEALALFNSGESWNIPHAQSRPSLLTTEFMGDVFLEQGKHEGAQAYYDEVWSKALALVPRGDIVAELRRRRAECLYLFGDYERAHEEASEGINHCRDLNDRYEEAATYRILALAAGALGKASQAKRWFDQGFAYFDDIEAPYEWGKLWLAYGDWLISSVAAEYQDLHEGACAYQTACDHLERIGAEFKLYEARERLARVTSEISPKRAVNAARPLRRPRGAIEIERKSRLARERFGIITNDVVMLGVLDDVAKLARSSSPVLILGESGTGKELIAHGVHRLSLRSGAFVPINCSALPREIIESELFGHVAGAFTGAAREKAGLFEVCDGGSVFLDEVGEMPLELQSKLLRFLETGEVRKVGAVGVASVMTRVVAATNRPRQLLERGEGFRTDLYYRLAHAVVELPPLRNRKCDIDALVDYFLQQSCDEEQRSVQISDDARLRLREYGWPGNVRQLRSVVRRIVLLASDGHLVMSRELQLDEERIPTTLTEELEGAERRRIADAMRAARGSRAEAARVLGMPRTTLINKLRRFGLQ